MKKKPSLSDFPEDEIIAEAFRIMRARQKGPAKPKALAPCPKCGVEMGARERRFKCPEHKPPGPINPSSG